MSMADAGNHGWIRKPDGTLICDQAGCTRHQPHGGTRRTAADVEALCALMHKYGLSKLRHGTIELERPPFAIAASLPEPKERDAEQTDVPDDFEKLRGMSPDQIDRALMLTPLGPP